MHSIPEPLAGTPNRMAEPAAICAMAALAVTTLNLSPGLEPRLRSELGLTPSQVGLFFMVELGAMALASLAFVPLMRRWPAKRVTRAALGLWVTGQCVSLPAMPFFGALLGARALAGLAAGLLMLVALEAAGRRTRPQRLLAMLVAAQIGGGAIGLAMLPLLWAAGGLGVVFVANAILGAAALALVRPLCASLAAWHDTAPAAPLARSGTTLHVFLVALLFNAAIGALWTFVPELAPPEVDPAGLAPLMAQATLFGLCGAAAAGALVRRGSPRLWRSVGLLLLAAAALGVHAAPGSVLFAIGCFATSFAWNFSVPFVLALGTPDEAGVSMMPAVNAAFAIGLAVGPPVGGSLLEAAGATGLVLGVMGLLVVAAALAARQSR